MKVRIAVAIDATGAWSAYGWGDVHKPPKNLEKQSAEMMSMVIENLEPGERRYWAEVDIELPVVETVQGAVFTQVG